jgi:hypothetical protein
MALIERTKRDVLQENLWLVLEHITQCDIDGDEDVRSNLHLELTNILALASVAGYDPADLYEQVVKWNLGRADLTNR